MPFSREPRLSSGPISTMSGPSTSSTSSSAGGHECIGGTAKRGGGSDLKGIDEGRSALRGYLHAGGGVARGHRCWRPPDPHPQPRGPFRAWVFSGGNRPPL